MKHKVIGISQSFSPAPFVRALKERLQSTFLPDGSRPRIELVDLDWSSPDADAPKLVQEGDVKIRVLEESYQLIEKGAQFIALCNFRNISFLNEVQTEITTPVTDILQACIEELKKNPVKKLGYLGRPGTDKAKLITETVSREVPVEWVYPSEAMLEVFDELESGSRCAVIPDQKKACELFGKVCSNLLSEGAELVFPTCVMQALFAATLKSEGYNVLDSMSAYVSYLCFTDWEKLPKPFKIGIVGGLGPAATVDLYDKITKATPAKNDQEHIKVAVEQNPQIPDRTKYLLHGGVDPTLSLYAACRKLEKDAVDAIVIACNTAHAYFETIVPHLSVPLINMQQVTLEEIRDKFGPDVVIGLMATDGTIETGIYGRKAKSMKLAMVVPDKEHQAMVMEAIYGEKGVKAGFTDGHCKEVLLKAAEHLVRDKGAQALILGCTELPLILEETDNIKLGDGHAAIVDPTASLARRVVKVAGEITKIRGVR